jgi:hypothetical protein
MPEAQETGQPRPSSPVLCLVDKSHYDICSRGVPFVLPVGHLSVTRFAILLHPLPRKVTFIYEVEERAYLERFAK